MRAIYPPLAYATVLLSLYSRCAGGVAASTWYIRTPPHCFEQPVALAPYRMVKWDTQVMIVCELCNDAGYGRAADAGAIQR
jgi:hypothetical protein